MLLCEEEQSELLCSSLTELSDPESTRGRRPAVRQTPCSWINVLLVSLQCNGCFLSGHIDICEVQLTLCYTAMIGKKNTFSLSVNLRCELSGRLE